MQAAIFVHQPVCSVDSANGIIKALAPHYSFKLFSRDEVESTFFDDVDLICIPGGIGDADRFDKLMQYNADHIRTFVNRGGRYLGICMGAYWAGQHYLDILQDIDCVQYIRRPGTDTRRPHAKTVPVSWQGEQHRMFFYDGCAVIGNLTTSKIIATYSNNDPMAVIQKNVGLIGCHPESEEYWYKNYSWMSKHYHNGIHHSLLREFVNELCS